VTANRLVYLLVSLAGLYATAGVLAGRLAYRWIRQLGS
jgi:hypothetical protein